MSQSCEKCDKENCDYKEKCQCSCHENDRKTKISNVSERLISVEKIEPEKEVNYLNFRKV